MTRAFLAGLATFAAISGVADAHGSSALPTVAISASRVPTATVKIYSPNPRTVWDGKGPAEETIDLCIASTTGRYRLEIVSQSGGALLGAQRMHYTLRLHDGAGVDRDVLVNEQALISLEGSAPPSANCDSGPNSTLSVRAPEGELLKGQAGAYFDRLRLLAAPL